MGLEQISTGYKPEFALGALYQGYNAGNADNAAQLENLSKEWELQKSRAEDPYKVLSSMYQGNLDNAKMQDPNYIPWQLAGQVGQMQTQEAQGRKAQALTPREIELTLLQQGMDKVRANEKAREYERIMQGNPSQGSGQIGFDMQSQPEPVQGVIGFPQGTSEPSAGRAAFLPPGSASKERNLSGLMGNFYRSGDNPNYTPEGAGKLTQGTPAQVAAERERLLAEGVQNANRPPSGIPVGGIKQDMPLVPTTWSGPGGMPTQSISQSQTTTTRTPIAGPAKDTPYSNLIPTQGKYAQLSGLEALDPKFIGDMAKLENKEQSAYELQAARLAMQEKIAGMRKQAIAGDKNAQQALVSFYKEQVASGLMTPSEYNLQMTAIFNRATDAKVQPGTQINPVITGPNATGNEQAIVQKSESPAYVPRSQQKPQQQNTQRKPLGEY